MQHIVHIAPTPFFADRGCHIRIEGIVRCLSQLGYGNTVCTYHHGRDIESVATKRIKPIHNYTQTAAGPSKYKLLADWRLLWLVFREVRRTRPCAIHAHLHEGLLIGFVVKVLLFWRRVPLIADMQGSLTGELDSYGAFNKLKPLKLITRWLEQVLMWVPNAIVCSSQHSLTKLRTEFSIPETKISLAQDGADEFPPLAEQTRQDLREQLGLPVDKTIAVYSGALLQSKGLNELKQLIKLSQSTNKHFLIIGYPSENLSPFLEAENLQGLCTLTGQVDFSELPTMLACCDIGIDPKNSSAGEGSGKMLNYLAVGLPVVAFNTDNNREFLPPDTPLADTSEELAELLDHLAKDSNARTRAGEQALQHFSAHFSWTKTKQQLADVYTQIVLPLPPSSET